jgi:hypothetical protein
MMTWFPADGFTVTGPYSLLIEILALGPTLYLNSRRMSVADIVAAHTTITIASCPT